MRNTGKLITAITIPAFFILLTVGYRNHGPLFDLGVISMLALPVGPSLWITGWKQERQARKNTRRTKDYSNV